MIRIHDKGTPLKMPHGHFHFDFKLRPSEALGLLGANGSGKSTFFQFLKLNRERFFPKLKVAFLDQLPWRPLGELRGLDLLQLMEERFSSELKSTSEREELLKLLGIEHKLKTPLNSLSGGENQLFKVLALFSQDADVYLLDEPTNNLDYQKVEVLKKLIHEHLENGKTMMITAHQRSFLKEVCSRYLTLEITETEEHKEIYACKVKEALSL